MKRIVCMMIPIIFILSFQIHSYHFDTMSFNNSSFGSLSKNNDNSSSSDFLSRGRFRWGVRRGKSFDSAHYQSLYQAPVQNVPQVPDVSTSPIKWNSIDLSKNSGSVYVYVPGSNPPQFVEVVCKPTDGIAKDILTQLQADCLMQRGLAEFQQYSNFLNGQLAAIENTLNYNVAFQKNYDTSQDIKDFLHEYKYDVSIVNKPFTGTYLQHYLHEQCLSIFDTVAHTQSESSSRVLQPIYGIVADLGWSALSYNIAGKIKTASQLVQGCLMLLDCASTVVDKSKVVVSAIGNTAGHIYYGAQQGVDNVIVVFCDPVQFVSNCAQAIKITTGAMLQATAIGHQFEVAQQLSTIDSKEAAIRIEELKRQVESIMQYIDASFDHVAQMPAGKILEAAVASIVEGLVWGALGKLCKFTVKTIPVISQAIKDGVAISEIAITTEGIPVHISAPKVVECMETVNAGINKQKLVARVVEVNKMRGKQYNFCHKSVTAKDMRPLNRLKGKDLIGIEDVSVRGYKPLSKRVVFDNYKHYLQAEIITTQEGMLRPSGWHHDPGKRIERIKRVNGHKIEIIDKEIHISGIYRFDWGVEGMDTKRSTFFPHTWSRETVQKKITEVFKYARKYHGIPEAQPNGKFSITGFTKDRIEVKVIINRKGEVITAYPLWPGKKYNVYS